MNEKNQLIVSWNYIQENDLQNQENKRYIILDDRLKTIVGDEEKLHVKKLPSVIKSNLEPHKRPNTFPDMVLSHQLAEFIGKPTANRAEVTKKM